uniref:Uncharacterized protein n=1 Tax=Glossina austeni TaxID=7395 RepID=A0A1A9UVY7_GLOAU
MTFAFLNQLSGQSGGSLPVEKEKHQFTQGTTYKGFEGSKPERFVINTLVISAALVMSTPTVENNVSRVRPQLIATAKPCKISPAFGPIKCIPIIRLDSSRFFTQLSAPANNRLATARPAFIATGVSLGRPFTTSPTAKMFGTLPAPTHNVLPGGLGKLNRSSLVMPYSKAPGPPCREGQAIIPEAIFIGNIFPCLAIRGKTISRELTKICDKPMGMKVASERIKFLRNSNRCNSFLFSDALKSPRKIVWTPLVTSIQILAIHVRAAPSFLLEIGKKWSNIWVAFKDQPWTEKTLVASDGHYSKSSSFSKHLF